jgi:hypothetical protein
MISISLLSIAVCMYRVKCVEIYQKMFLVENVL